MTKQTKALFLLVLLALTPVHISAFWEELGGLVAGAVAVGVGGPLALGVAGVGGPLALGALMAGGVLVKSYSSESCRTICCSWCRKRICCFNRPEGCCDCTGHFWDEEK